MKTPWFVVTLGFLLVLSVRCAHAADTGATPQPLDPEQHKLIQTDRPDGRYLSTRGYVQERMREVRPRLAFDPSLSPEGMRAWQVRVRAKMTELMHFPEVPPQPEPKLLSRTKRTGYTVEKWECYPLPGSVVPFLMLVPDAASAQAPAPAVLCYPGSDNTKENLAGEPELNPTFNTRHHPDLNHMAMFYAQQGIVAVAVDNPGIAEISDLGAYAVANNDRDTFSRYLIDLGWSYMGLSTYNGKQILAWLRSRDFIDRRRIALSGHSLGTEPVLALAVTEPGIRAVVFNDFLCRNIERATVTTKPSPEGIRPPANGLTHCVPGMWEWFDYPDLVASLAPLPLAITEGGPTANLELVRRAYRIAGEESAVQTWYYPKYSEPRNRRDGVKIPEGLDPLGYMVFANVDAPNHYFKGKVAVPWLTRVLRP